MNRAIPRSLGNTLLPLATLGIFFAFWQAAVSLLEIPPYLLPPPGAVFRRLVHDSGSLAYHTGITALAAGGGLALGALGGWATAVVFSSNRLLRRMFYPYLIALKSVPIVVLAPLIALWLGTHVGSRIAVVLLTCYFPLLVNSLKGLLSTDRSLLELSVVYRASQWRELFLLRLPSSLPFFFAGLKVASVLAVVAALVAEMMGADSGLGFVLMISVYRTDTEALFCVTLLSAALGMATFGAAVEWERRMFPWISSSNKEEL